MTMCSNNGDAGEGNACTVLYVGSKNMPLALLPPVTLPPVLNQVLNQVG
jgi:hypothetical protein